MLLNNSFFSGSFSSKFIHSPHLNCACVRIWLATCFDLLNPPAYTATARAGKETVENFIRKTSIEAMITFPFSLFPNISLPYKWRFKNQMVSMVTFAVFPCVVNGNFSTFFLVSRTDVSELGRENQTHTIAILRKTKIPFRFCQCGCLVCSLTCARTMHVTNVVCNHFRIHRTHYFLSHLPMMSRDPGVLGMT